MKKYNYKCFDCGKTYDPEEIEKNFIYLCPDCGKLEKNQPLRGILLINYDYDSIKIKYRKDDLLKLQPGKFWQYDYLWPIDSSNGIVNGIDEKILNRISTEVNCLQNFSYEGKDFLALDDTRNPTLSFKDRASTLVAVKALQMGIKEIAAASTGNAGSSLAGICARLGLKSIVFVPKNIPDAKRIQIQSYGAELIIVDGDYDLAFDSCLEISQQKKWYNRNTAYNPLTIEGKKSASYDIFTSTKGKLPEQIFVPVGDGVIISGIFKGFWELKELGWIEKIPELIAVQARGSNAVVRYWTTKQFEYKPAVSIADSICAGAPRALFTAYNAIQKSNGDALEVSDNDIIGAQKIVAQKFGILLEPSSAVTFAGFLQHSASNDHVNKSSLLIFSGNGLKDLSSLEIWNQKIIPLSPEQVRREI
jgi:threonine synthase